jgi:adenylate cyclase
VMSGTVVWAGDAHGVLDDLTAPFNPVAGEIIAAVTAAIFEHEIRRARAQPLPTLRSHSLLYGAIGLMHRLSLQDFERAHALLEHLTERHPRAPEPRVWQAKWHVLRITQGWSADPARQAGQAHDSVQRALDQQSDHALALAIDGLIAGFLDGDLDTSERRYRQALALNPNEAFAWLFLSALHAYRDRGDEAVECANTAIRLSPLDPVRYYFDSFLANALLAAGRCEESIAVGQRSVRSNCTHMPTYRSLAIAQVMAGMPEAARQTVTRLLQAHPGYSLQEFRTRYAGRHGSHAERYEEALRIAGLPER